MNGVIDDCPSSTNLLWQHVIARILIYYRISISPLCYFAPSSLQYKLAVIAALVASASAFAPSTQITRSTAIFQEKGKGGMADTRDPETYQDEDPRKSISAAPSFEEYLKQRQAEGN